MAGMSSSINWCKMLVKLNRHNILICPCMKILLIMILHSFMRLDGAILKFILPQNIKILRICYIMYLYMTR